MAIKPIEAPQAPPKDKKKEPKSTGETFDRTKFIQGVDTGREINWRGQEVKTRKEFKITKETRDKFTHFLTDYVAQVGRGLRENPNFRDNPYSRVGIRFYDALTVNGEVEPTKMTEFLKKEENWALTLGVMDQYILDIKKAQGFMSLIEFEGKRNSVANPITIRTTPADFWSKFGERAGAAIRWFLDKSPDIKLVPNADLFKAMQGDDAKKAYFKTMTGMDLDDYQVAGNRIQKVQGRVPSSNRDPKELQKEATKVILARRAFLGSFADLKKLDSSPHEQLARNTIVKNGFEQSSVILYQDIIDELQVNQGGIRDWADRGVDDPNFCMSVGVGFMGPGIPDYENLDTVGNIERWEQASFAILDKMSVSQLGDAIHQKNVGLKSDVKARAASTVESARKQEAKTQQSELEAKKTDIAGKKESFKTFDEKETAIKKLEKDLVERFGLPFGTDFVGAIDAEVTKLTDELNGAVGVLGLKEQSLVARQNWQREYDTQYAGIATAWRAGMGAADRLDMAAVKESATAAADMRYGDERKRLERDVSDREQRVLNLNNLKDQYGKAIKALAEAEAELVRNVPKDLNETSKSYEILINPAGGGATIADTDLDKKTVDELIKDATRSPYSIRNRTPEDKENLRRLIIRAKTERRARLVGDYSSPGTGSEIASFNSVVAAPGTTINEDALLSMPDGQLLHKLNTDAVYAPIRIALVAPRTIRDILNEAKKVAQSKLALRYKISIEEQVKDFDEQIKTQQGIIDKEDKKEAKAKEKAGYADAILSRQGEILRQHARVKKEVDKFTDNTALVNTDTTFTEAERAKGQPKGYYEMMNLLFNYQAKQGLERASYFEKLYQFMPPKELARRLNESFGLGTMGAGATDINIILQAIQNRIKSHGADKISYSEIIDGLDKFMVQLGKEAAVV